MELLPAFEMYGRCLLFVMPTQTHYSFFPITRVNIKPVLDYSYWYYNRNNNRKKIFGSNDSNNKAVMHNLMCLSNLLNKHQTARIHNLYSIPAFEAFLNYGALLSSHQQLGFQHPWCCMMIPYISTLHQ